MHNSKRSGLKTDTCETALWMINWLWVSSFVVVKISHKTLTGLTCGNIYRGKRQAFSLDTTVMEICWPFWPNLSVMVFINWFLPCLACVVNFNIPVNAASVAKVSYPRASGSNRAPRDPRGEKKKTRIFRSTSKCFSWFVSPLFHVVYFITIYCEIPFLKRIYRIFMVEIFNL